MSDIKKRVTAIQGIPVSSRASLENYISVRYGISISY
jgi:hypothetical protein